jgi:hypothetical protein
MSLCDIPDLACKGSKRGIPVNQPSSRICKQGLVQRWFGMRWRWFEVVCCE